MVKNWADHCSSDDEEDFQERVEQLDAHLKETEQMDVHLDDPHYQDHDHNNDGGGHKEEEEEAAAAPNQQLQQRTYDFPSDPPFTAYIGNLAYSITEPEQLRDQMIQLVRDRLNLADFNVIEAKVIKDRATDRPRGFGYIEVDTLEMLQALMDLNDTGATLAGRRIQLDTANHSSHSNNNNNNNNRRDSRRSNNHHHNNNNNMRGSGRGFGDIDGTQFRGGRYNNQNRQHHDNTAAAASGAGDGEVRQRPSLKLKPRTKPLENTTTTTATATTNNNNSNDAEAPEPRRHSTGGARGFTGGSNTNTNKPRDETTDGSGPWRRKSESMVHGGGRHGGRDGGRGGDRGGRGRSGGGGGGGRSNHNNRDGGRGGGRHNNSNRNNHHNNNNNSNSREEPKAPAAKVAAAPPAPAEPKKVTETKVVNSFAALAFDSDSD